MPKLRLWNGPSEGHCLNFGIFLFEIVSRNGNFVATIICSHTKKQPFQVRKFLKVWEALTMVVF